MASEADESSTPVRVRAPIGVRVAANVEALRKARGWSQQQLSDRMAELGRPLIVTAVSKVEQGQRRVDVDDLVALALALGVNPSRLLLTTESGDEMVELAPAFIAPAWGAWQWADGMNPVPTRGPDDDWNSEDDYETFARLARPARVGDYTSENLQRLSMFMGGHIRRLAAVLIKEPEEEASMGMPNRVPALLRWIRRDMDRLKYELDALEEEVAERKPRR